MRGMRLWRSVVAMLAIAGVLALPGFGRSAAAAGVTTVAVTLDGSPVASAVPSLLVQGSLMLHAKGALDALKMAWTYEKPSLTIRSGGTVLKAKVGQPVVVVGDRQLQLTQAPALYKGRLYVPARLLGAALGKSVQYDSARRQLNIGYAEASKDALQRSLITAARGGDANAIADLLKRGADPNGKLVAEFGDNTPLAYAVLFDKTDAVRALLQGGAGLEGTGQPLGFAAIVSQNAEILDLLLSAGLDPNAKDAIGTLLEEASGTIGISSEGSEAVDQPPSLAVVQTLLKHGADPRADNALYQAVNAQSYGIIQSLLQAGADPYKASSNGASPYERSAELNISRWLTLQAEPIEPPSFRVADAQGQTVQEGQLILRPLDEASPQPPNRNLSWTAGLVHADLPDGRYRVVGLTAGDCAYYLPQNSTISLQEGRATPDTVTLPEPNVRVALVGNPTVADGGYVSLYSSQASAIAIARVYDGAFSLFAAAGEYQIFEYRDAAGHATPIDRTITVGGAAGIQHFQIALGNAASGETPQPG